MRASSLLVLCALLLAPVACTDDTHPPSDAAVDAPIASRDFGADSARGADSAPSPDLPPLRDATFSFDFDIPHLRPPDATIADATTLAAQQDEEVLWGLDSEGGQDLRLQGIHATPSGGIGLLIDFSGTLTFAGTPLQAASHQTWLLEISAQGQLVRQIVVAEGEATFCRARALGQDTFLLCETYEKVTLLPGTPLESTHDPNAKVAFLAALGSDLAPRFVRRLEGYADDRLHFRVAHGTLVLFGGFDERLQLDGEVIVDRGGVLAFWGGAGFIAVLSPSDGTLSHALEVGGEGTSAFADVLIHPDGSLTACGLVGGYSGTGINVASLEAASGDPQLVFGLSDDDPSGNYYLAGFDDQGLARWSSSLWGRQELMSPCSLQALGTNHFQAAFDGYSGLLLGAGQANAKVSGATPVALYQNDGVFIEGQTVAVVESAQGIYGLLATALGGSAFHVATASEALLAPYGPSPLRLTPRLAAADETLGAMQVVVETQSGQSLQSVAWGLQPRVPKSNYAPWTHFLYSGDGTAYLAGATYHYTVRLGDLELGGGSEYRLFVARSRLAR